MKRINELSRDELVALTGEQIERYVDIECAEEGVALLPPAPVEPEKNAPEPDIECWTVPTVTFRDRAHALEVIELINQLSRVIPDPIGGWRYGYDSYYTPVDPGEDRQIEPKLERMWSPAHFDAARVVVDAAKRERDAYTKAKDEYRKAVDARAEISKRVREVVNSAHSEVWEEDNVRREFARYVEIADGDKDTALRFFKNAHKSYDDEWLLPVLGIPGPIPVAE